MSNINICEFCKSENKVVERNILGSKKYLCDNCANIIDNEIIGLFAVENWKKSYEIDENFQNFIDLQINEMINGCEDIDEMYKKIISYLEMKIDFIVKFYNKSEYIIALMFVKEFLLKQVYNQNYNFWKIGIDIHVINYLIKKIMSIDYNGANILNGDNDEGYFIHGLCYARRIILIFDNFEKCKNLSIGFVKKYFFEGVDNKNINQFYECYKNAGLNDKMEDYIISDNFNTGLKRIKKSKSQLLDRLYEIFKATINLDLRTLLPILNLLLNASLNINHISNVYQFILSEYNIGQHIYNKDTLQNLFGKDNYDCLERHLSINSHYNSKDFLNCGDMYPLYFYDNYVVFSVFDLIRCLDVITKMYLSNHYSFILSDTLTQNKDLSSLQDDVNTYYTYCIADLLIKNNYYIPLMGNLPFIEYKPQIDDDIGDYDILCLNKMKKEILIIEIKFFKPSNSNYDIFKLEKAKINKTKVFEKMKKREKYIVDNKSIILNDFFKLNISPNNVNEYHVKSILFTSRVIYSKYENVHSFKCLDWESLNYSLINNCL